MKASKAVLAAPAAIGVQSIARADLPRIGAPIAGGIFAGIARGEEGDHALVLLAEAPKHMKWKQAMTWAQAQGAALPTRGEQAVLFGNLKDQFADGDWYWSCEQCAGDESYAWCQYFNYGTQGNDLKGDELRARAVRRLPIQ